MSYWACARLALHRERIALHCLELAGYATYLPRLRERRISRGRKVEVSSPLFPGYAFVMIELQWSAARWTVGVLGLILNGDQPARVADSIIDEIKGRERNGAIELVARPRFKPGDPVRVVSGPFVGLAGLYQGMNGHQRVAVLLSFLGGPNRTELPASAIEPIEASR